MRRLESPAKGIVFYDYVDRTRPGPPPSVTEQILRDASRREVARRRAWLRSLAPRESATTLMLGGSALALGVIVLAVTASGIAGVPLGDWHEPYSILVSEGTRARPVAVYRDVFMPSDRCVRLAWPGMLLGLAGVVASRRGRFLSWISAGGFACCLGSIWAFVLYEIFMNVR